MSWWRFCFSDLRCSWSSWQRFSHDVVGVVLEGKDGCPSSLSLFFLSSFSPISLSRHLTSKRILSFLRTFSLLGDAGSGNRGESSFIPFPSSTVPVLSSFFLCIYIVVMRTGRRDSSADHSPLTNRNDGCGVVVTTAEQLVWMKRDMKPRPSFLFSPGPFWIQWICKLPWIKLAISKLVT